MTRAYMTLITPLLATFVAIAPVRGADAELVPTPRARVLAVSATNRPLLAANRTQQPVDLAARGYTEAELLVSGYANTYEWAPSNAARGAAAVAVRSAAVPYATRLLVRRPIAAGSFSGRVIVELLDASQQYESAALWGLSHDYFLRRGDVWVGVTVSPAAIATLQKFDAVRYGALALVEPQAQGCQVSQDSASGLVWDLAAQVGALLRSSSKENPLLDLNPQRVWVAGYAGASGLITTFANVVHQRMRMGDSGPVFNGYFSAGNAGVAAAIHPCAAPLPATDSRLTVLPREVPFVTIVSESDAEQAAPRHRADSDAPDDVFRWYEIAGAARAGPFGAGLPERGDVAIAGLTLPAADLCREPLSDLPQGLAYNAIWQQLDDWQVRKLPMVSVPRLEVNAGASQGGWRLPQLVVPLARYVGRNVAQQAGDAARLACESTGAMERFEAARLKTLYRDRGEYLRRYHTAIDLAVQNRQLVKEDAQMLKAQPARTFPAF